MLLDDSVMLFVEFSQRTDVLQIVVTFRTAAGSQLMSLNHILPSPCPKTLLGRAMPSFLKTNVYSNSCGCVSFEITG